MNVRAVLKKGSSSSNLLRPFSGTALLGLLALTLPLQAQANNRVPGGCENCTASVQSFAGTDDKSLSSAGRLSGLSSDSQPLRQPGITLLATSAALPSTATSRIPKPDINRNSYYKNRLDFSLEAGGLPINIPFVFDFLLGDGYNMTPLKYTLAPFIASLRWQMNDVSGPSILRGNWESSFSGAYTMIPRGPETRFFAYIMGIRRNFVQPRWRISPYLEGRVGTGDINAKGPKGVAFAQGQDYTFTLMLGSGLRYNISPRYAFWAGAGYMHISNLYLSEPKYLNYGINVWGPMFGVDVRLGKRHPRQTAQQGGPVKTGM